MHRIKNYGSILQAYALKNIVESFGYNVEFVDYHVGKVVGENKKKKPLVNKLKKVFEVFKQKTKFICKIRFLIYKNNFSKKYNKILNIDSNYHYNTKVDTLLIGSDEVFNCIQDNSNVGYSLELFGMDNNAKKVITYAASFGNTTLEKLKTFNKLKEIGYYLNRLDSISVRDDNSKKIVEKLTKNKIIYKHFDPVLIYDYSKDNNFADKIELKDDYIIVYSYNDRITGCEAEKIKNYARKNKYKIYCIGGSQKCIDKFIDCSPFEIFSYFKNAKCIITDTFHGTIFSILTRKPFVTIVRQSTNLKYGNEEKLDDLLNEFNLRDRKVYNCDQLESKMSQSIDYNSINKKILLERKKTYQYLKDNLR